MIENFSPGDHMVEQQRRFSILPKLRNFFDAKSAEDLVANFRVPENISKHPNLPDKFKYLISDIQELSSDNEDIRVILNQLLKNLVSDLNKILHDVSLMSKKDEFISALTALFIEEFDAALKKVQDESLVPDAKVVQCLSEYLLDPEDDEIEVVA